MGGAGEEPGASQGDQERKLSLRHGSLFLGCGARLKVGQNACSVPAWVLGHCVSTSPW